MVTVTGPSLKQFLARLLVLVQLLGIFQELVGVRFGQADHRRDAAEESDIRALGQGNPGFLGDVDTAAQERDEQYQGLHSLKRTSFRECPPWPSAFQRCQSISVNPCSRRQIRIAWRQRRSRSSVLSPLSTAVSPSATMKTLISNGSPYTASSLNTRMTPPTVSRTAFTHFLLFHSS